MAKFGLRGPFWERMRGDLELGQLSHLPGESWVLAPASSGEYSCLPEHLENPNRHRQRRHRGGYGPRTRASKARGRGALARPGRVVAPGVSGVRVCLGVRGVPGLCVFWPLGGGEARGPAGREHTALSALTKPLCVAQGGGVAASTPQRARAKHFLLGYTRPSLSPAGSGAGRLSLPDHTFPLRPERRKATLVLVS